jgi:hypothetical protein
MSLGDGLPGPGAYPPIEIDRMAIAASESQEVIRQTLHFEDRSAKVFLHL